MPSAPKDRWATKWKLHRDPRKIFQGVKDLEFELVPINSGTNFKVYDFDYEPDSATDDPFHDTQFVRLGDDFPAPPAGKLVPWIPDLDVENDYQQLIDNTFNSAPSNIVRLIGEKIFKYKKELIILTLIPDAIDTVNGNPRIIDLIHVGCSTHAAHGPASFFQDGTAHGNPR